jgi:hypothetical protein
MVGRLGKEALAGPRSNGRIILIWIFQFAGFRVVD